MRRLTDGHSVSESTGPSLTWLAAAGLSAIGLFAVAKLTGGTRRPVVDLRGKIALITGGSRGLGLALAQELGGEGCRVALCARDEGELNEAAQHLQQRGIDVAVFACDLTDETQIASLVSRVLEHFGRIDVVVNDAGLIKVAPIDNTSHTDFEEAMNLMFWAPVNLTMAVLPHMKRQGAGHIVNITSVGGRVAVPHLLAYSCAKFAFVGFSTGLSSELDSKRLHVLTVVPGLMRTGSYLNAKFKGVTGKEFEWFALLGNLPGFSVSAGDAARSIRQALQARQLTCTISLPAKLLIQSEAIVPELTRRIMQLVNEFVLPAAGSNEMGEAGKVSDAKFGPVFRALTLLGRNAARSLNE